MRLRSAAVAAGLFTSLTVLVPPRAATAQSCAESPPASVFIGTPTTGSMGVPTNVVFFYKIPAHLGAPAPGMFYLHSEKGETISLHEERVYGDFLELKPARPLEPNMSHQLSGTWGVTDRTDDALLFWTGDGPFKGPPEPPQAQVQHYRVATNVAESKCGPARVGTCLAFGARDAVVEYTLIDDAGEEQAAAIALGAALVDLTALDPAQQARCVKLRARGPDGSFSDPVTVCGEDYPVWQANEGNVSCDPTGLSWEGMPASPTVVRAPHASSWTTDDAGTAPHAAARKPAADGCSVHDPARAGARLEVTALGVGLIVLRRRRARSKG